MKKSNLLLRILAVIGRFGRHLTIVVTFVTQNNFKNGPGIFDRLLGFYQSPNQAAAAEVVIQETNPDTRCQSEIAVERHTLWDFGCRGQKTSVKRTESETGRCE